MVVFTDGAGLIITGKGLMDCYEEVLRWMKSVGLELDNHKTKAVLCTSRKKVETITLDVGQCTITSQPNVRYLGMMLDTRLNKAARVANALARPMPNIGGPRQTRRKLLASVVTSILTYGIAIWAEAVKIEKY